MGDAFNTARNLLASSRLLFGSRRDLLDHVLYLLRKAGNLVQAFARFVCEFQSVLNLVYSLLHRGHCTLGIMLDTLDHVRDFFGRLGRPLRQLAHFVRHDRKSTALLAGARRLDRSIKRQQIGLVGDIVDHAGNLADLVDDLESS